jgi:hypothetical protein
VSVYREPAPPVDDVRLPIAADDELEGADVVLLAPPRPEGIWSELVVYAPAVIGLLTLAVYGVAYLLR